MHDFLFALTVLAALGCGLNAGVFFAFSAFVMPALRRLPAPEGIAAMQSINVTAVTPAFMSALFGTALACTAVIVAAISTWEDSSGAYLVGGGGLYLFGTIGPTIVYHVPRNDALAKVDPESLDGARYWTTYLAEWTRLNHLRSAAGLAGAALLTVALNVG